MCCAVLLVNVLQYFVELNCLCVALCYSDVLRGMTHDVVLSSSLLCCCAGLR